MDLGDHPYVSTRRLGCQGCPHASQASANHEDVVLKG
jgi:hypothetical protein